MGLVAERTQLNEKLEKMRENMMIRMEEKEQETMLNFTFTLWNQFTISEKHNAKSIALQREIDELTGKVNSNMDRMKLLIGAKDDDTLKASTFGGWKKYAFEEKKDREIEELNKQVKHLMSKMSQNIENLRKKFQMNDAGYLLKESFAAWKNDVFESKNAAERERMQQEIGCQALARLRFMFGTDPRHQCMTVLQSWRDEVVRSQHEKANNLAADAKNMQFMKMFEQDKKKKQDFAVLEAFSAWKSLVWEEHRAQRNTMIEDQMRKIVELETDVDNMMKKQLQSFEKMSKSLAGSTSKGLLTTTFAAWKEETQNNGAAAKMMEMKSMQALRSGQEMGKKFLIKLFSEWKDIVEEAKMEQKLQDNLTRC